MNKLVKFGAMFLTLMLLLVTCGDDDDGPTDPTDESKLGDINPSSFVAIGNSLTAGFISAALIDEGQENSFPNLINTQMNSADNLTNAFGQPTISYPGISSTPDFGILEWIALPSVITQAAGNGDLTNLDVTTYRNLGVPGAATIDVLNASDATTSASGTNSFFNLIVQGQTQFQRAKALKPTFMTLWIGNNDVLGYATSGGVSPAAPTPSDAFAFLYSQLADSIATLDSLGNDVVVANIPNITDIPYFTTVGPILEADTLIPAVYYVSSTGDTTTVNFAVDLVLLTASSVVGDTTGCPGSTTCRGLHPLFPLGSQYVLDAAEITIAEAAVTAFNTTIASVATAKGWALVDMNAFLASVKDGVTKQGVDYSAAFISGQTFSLDGVHGTGRGNGLLANEFIAVMNSNFNADIAEVTLADLPANSVKGTAKIAIGALDGMLETFGADLKKLNE